MSMFVLDGKNVVKPTPEALLIPEFKAIWSADLTHAKDKALKEFSFVWFSTHYNSPFRERYSPDEIEEQIKIQVLKDPKWRVPERVKSAIKVYSDLLNVQSRQVFDTAEHILSQLHTLLKKESDTLKLETATKLIDLMVQIPKVTEQLKLAKDAMFKELQASKKGKGIVSKYENPEDQDSITDYIGIIG